MEKLSANYFWKLLKGHRRAASVVLFVILAAACAEMLSLGLIVPLLKVIMGLESKSGHMNGLIGNYSALLGISKLTLVSLAFLFFIVMKNLLIVFSRYLTIRFSCRYYQEWSSGIFNKYLHASYEYMLSQQHGKLVHNVVTEAGNASKSILSVLDFVSRIVLSLALFGLMLSYNWQMTLAASLILGVTYLLMRKPTDKYSLNYGKEKLTLQQKIMTRCSEAITGLQQVRIFGIAGVLLSKFSQKLQKRLNLAIRFRVVSALPKSLFELSIVMMIVVYLIFYGSKDLSAVKNSIPTMGMFVLAYQRIFSVISELVQLKIKLYSQLPSLQLISQLYASSIPVESSGGNEEIQALDTDIRFDSVVFGYSGHAPLFKNLNIQIQKNKTTALVGPSGSGKSSLINLIFRLYDPSGGSILVNGKSIQSFDIESWRKLVGYVSQDIYLFNASVRDNILIGKLDATEDEILDACIKANADSFISQLPEGYKTQLGEKGMTLSGGQRQRIAIARILLRDPDLLIFDEATSALDAESEQFIRESISRFADSKTIIVISHRLSSVMNSDYIYYLDQGKVVEHGTGDELTGLKGKFYKMQMTS